MRLLRRRSGLPLPSLLPVRRHPLLLVLVLVAISIALVTMRFRVWFAGRGSDDGGRRLGRPHGGLPAGECRLIQFIAVPID